MKRTRRGFTLVELLIVITILGTLAAAMSSSTGNATARAKAASIVANVEACKTAAAIFYNDHWDDATVTEGTNENTKMSETTAGAFLYENSTYIPNWADFAKAGQNVVFSVETGEKGRDNWAIKVDFTADAEADNIADALAKIKGYSGVSTTTTTEAQGDTPASTTTTRKTSFTVKLTTGKVTPSN